MVWCIRALITTVLKSTHKKLYYLNLPDQETLKTFEPINILLAPPGCKEVQYYSDTTNGSYFDKLFVETIVTCNI